MNVQRFANVGDYMRDLMRAIDRQFAVRGHAVFAVEVSEGGLTDADVDLLK